MQPHPCTAHAEGLWCVLLMFCSISIVNLQYLSDQKSDDPEAAAQQSVAHSVGNISYRKSFLFVSIVFIKNAAFLPITWRRSDNKC